MNKRWLTGGCRVGTVVGVALIVWNRLQLGSKDPSRTVFGDTGDGFFNLWILEHLRLNLTRGWSALSDGRMLHPAPETFWGSDNLITLSPPYMVSRAFGFSMLEAGTFATVFWMAGGFMAAFWLFSEVRKTLQGDVPNVGTFEAWLPFGFAAVATLIPARIFGLQHFQNHALVIWVALTACCVRFLRTRSTGACVGMGVGLAALMASAPYYAILGLFPLLACGIALLSDPGVDWKRLSLRQAPWAVLPLLLVLPVAWAYLQTETREFAEAELLRTAWTFRHGLPPVDGGRTHGYPGAWLLPAILFLSVGLFVTIDRGQLKRLRSPAIVGWMVLTGLTLLKVREIYPVTAWIRLGVQLAAVVMCVRAVRVRNRLPLRVLLMLGLATVLVTGTAMGPGRFFGEQSLDPSVWGLGARVIPGYRGMRELIRFVPAASVLALAGGYALALWLRPRIRSGLWVGAVGLVLVAGLADPWRPQASRQEVGEVALTPKQAEFASTLEGVLVEVPAAPFHRNPTSMLRWQPFRSLRLVNGYSGQCPPGFQDVISAENHFGRASPEQVEAALAVGADWMSVRRGWVPDTDEAALAQRFPTVYQDDTLLVVQLREEPSPIGDRAEPSDPRP